MKTKFKSKGWRGKPAATKDKGERQSGPPRRAGRDRPVEASGTQRARRSPMRPAEVGLSPVDQIYSAMSYRSVSILTSGAAKSTTNIRKKGEIRIT